MWMPLDADVWLTDMQGDRDPPECPTMANIWSCVQAWRAAADKSLCGGMKSTRVMSVSAFAWRHSAHNQTQAMCHLPHILQAKAQHATCCNWPSRAMMQTIHL
jgi:hypothetical protein